MLKNPKHSADYYKVLRYVEKYRKSLKEYYDCIEHDLGVEVKDLILYEMHFETISYVEISYSATYKGLSLDLTNEEIKELIYMFIKQTKDEIYREFEEETTPEVISTLTWKKPDLKLQKKKGKPTKKPTKGKAKCPKK